MPHSVVLWLGIRAIQWPGVCSDARGTVHFRPTTLLAATIHLNRKQLVLFTFSQYK